MSATDRAGQILERWRAGDNGVSIARELGIGSTTVYRTLEKHGIRASREQKTRVHYKRKHTRDEELEIVRRYQEGETLASIARAFECHTATVRNVALRHGVEIRPVGGRFRRWSDAEVEEIQRRWRDGERQGDLAAAFNTATSQIKYLTRALRRGSPTPGRSGVVRQGAYLARAVASDDPLASMRTTTGYVMEHRLVLARALGRPLARAETVHHLNGDHHDNRLENLQLRQGNHGRGAAHRCRDCGSQNIEALTLH